MSKNKKANCFGTALYILGLVDEAAVLSVNVVKPYILANCDEIQVPIDGSVAIFETQDPVTIFRDGIGIESQLVSYWSHMGVILQENSSLKLIHRNGAGNSLDKHCLLKYISDRTQIFSQANGFVVRYFMLRENAAPFSLEPARVGWHRRDLKVTFTNPTIQQERVNYGLIGSPDIQSFAEIMTDFRKGERIISGKVYNVSNTAFYAIEDGEVMLYLTTGFNPIIERNLAGQQVYDGFKYFVPTADEFKKAKEHPGTLRLPLKALAVGIDPFYGPEALGEEDPEFQCLELNIGQFDQMRPEHKQLLKFLCGEEPYNPQSERRFKKIIFLKEGYAKSLIGNKEAIGLPGLLYADDMFHLNYRSFDTVLTTFTRYKSG